MKKALFFTDIEGTFSPSRENAENRPELLEKLFTRLQHIAKVKGIDKISFSFVSSNACDDVQKYIDEVQPYINDERFPNVVWGRCFSENHTTHPAENYGTFTHRDDKPLFKSSAILQEIAIAQQEMKIERFSEEKEKIRTIDMDSSAKIELLLKLKESKDASLAKIKQIQEEGLPPFPTQIFEGNHPTPEVFFADDVEMYHSMLDTIITKYENTPEIVHFHPGTNSSEKSLGGTVSLIDEYSKSLNPVF